VASPQATSLRAGFATLQIRNFRSVFAAQTISVIGDGITPVALTFAVLGLTGSGTDLGLVLAAQALPLALLSLVGGVWADRLRRERVMIASDLVRAAVQLTAAALLLSGTARVWHLALLAALHGAAEAFFRPAAGGLLPQIVPPAHLQPANALLGMADNFGWFVGPAIAGVLVAWMGTGGAVAVDGLTFLVSAALLSRLAVPPLVRRVASSRFVAELAEGWREVRSRRWLFVMLLRAMLVLCLVIAPFQVLGPIALTDQGYSAAAWGAVMAVFSLGMLGGAFVAMRYRPRRPMLTVTLTGSLAVSAPLTLALGGGPVALATVQGVRGIGVGVLVAVWNTTLQTQVRQESLGRVTAWDWMASLALWPAGLAIAGPASEVLGVTTACWLSAGLGVIASLWVLLVRDVWRLRPAPSLSHPAASLQPGPGVNAASDAAPPAPDATAVADGVSPALHDEA
jgi:MFS family permease